MKTIKLSTLLCATILMSFTSNQRVTSFVNPTAEKSTSIKWKQTEIELGEITQNKPVTVEFEFTNDGEMPVVISAVRASCGCTGTNFSQAPILPGEKGKVSAIYNAAAVGNFRKTVAVNTNAEEVDKILTLSGTVIQAMAQKEAAAEL